MVIFTNVKINIGLDILRRRPDGYHDIATIMVPVPWHDIIEIVPAENGVTTLQCSGRPVDCPPEKNLVMKAYRKLQERVDLPPVDIYLHKIVPDGAGLGGGSADAAYTLRALNEMFSLGLSRQELAEVAASVGADCPFFIYDTPMLATGIGEILTPVEIQLKGYHLGIVKPDTKVSTAEAYASVTPDDSAAPLEQITAMPPHEWRNKAVNHFEDSLFPSHPELAAIKQKLYQLGALYASMSGSGAALFGIFANGDNLSEILKEQFADCDIFCCKL